MKEYGLQRAEKPLLPLGPTRQRLVNRASRGESREVWFENLRIINKETAIKILEKRE